MGFDLFGLNPKLKSEKPATVDYRNSTEEERAEFFEKMEKFEKENKGYYFRNNVWWWRPLANYIIDHTGCVDRDDEDKWHENGGHEVDEETAKMIAQQLKHLVSTGHTETFAKEHMEEYEKATLHNEAVEKKMQEFQEQMDKKYGRDIAPANYNADDYKIWNSIYSMKNWKASYPFNVDNVKEFAEFAEESGGFSIC
jgi:hypothetical protein